MQRKITSDFLSNKQKKTLRDYLSGVVGKPFRSITEIKKYYDTDSADLAYEKIRVRYNDNIEEARRAVRAKQARERRQTKAIPVIWDKRYPDTDVVLNDLKEISKKIVGRKLVYIQFDAITGEKSFIYRVPDKDSDTIYWELYHIVFKYIDGDTVCIILPNTRLVILQTEEVIPKKLQQKYRDGGEKHCVIEPIYYQFMTYANNAEKESSRKTFISKANKIKKYEEVYPEGVPESDMEVIAKSISYCIVIHDIVGNEVKRYNASSTRSLRFTNTRANHLEYGKICVDVKATPVTQDELNNLVREHDRDGIFYLMMNNQYDYNIIKSCRGCWCVVNPENDVMEKFSNEIGIRKYSYDALKNPQMNELIYEARIINACPTPLCDEPNNVEGANYIDLTKAYTQHRLCPYYMGFLGVIHQWRKLNITHNVGDFLESHLGIFQFRVTSRDHKLLNMFGIFRGTLYSLPSVEILYFIREFKMTCVLTAGCWGSRFDFDYTDEMLENRRYCLWAGKNGSQFDDKIYTFKGEESWCAHLKSELGNENVFYFPEKSIIACKVKQNVSYTRHHILAFITSYTRINMFEIIRKIPSESLIKVILDGLYFRGEIPDIKVPHKCNKELKTHLAFKDFWYNPSNVDVSKWAKYKKEFDGNCVLAGAGGTGKTHTILTDKGFVNPLYISPMHTLGQEIRNKYGVQYDTMHKLVGKGCLSRREIKQELPPVILIDELTMHDGVDITKAIEMYPESLIFVAGDIDGKQWYQCRNGTNGDMNELWMPTDWRYVFFETDYRSLDNELREFKLKVREKMREIFTNGGLGDAGRLSAWVAFNYNPILRSTAIEQFREGDIWIAGTNGTNKRLLEQGIISGYLKDKRIVDKCDGAEARGSFTIHSFQGLTVPEKKVFVSLDNFEYAMFYTAISRVRRFSQLVFVL